MKNRPFFSFFCVPVRRILEHLQLLDGGGGKGGGMTVKDLHHTELLIGYAHNADMSFFRQDMLDPQNMNIGIFAAATVTHVNGELKHLKSIFHNVFTELSVYFTLQFGFRRQVKKYQYPQYSICV
jgi:hypothetical protein